jgi:hypothetical protein
MNTIHQRLERRNNNYSDSPSAHLLLEDIVRDTGGRLGIRDIPCPFCGPPQLTPRKRHLPKLRVYQDEPGFARYNCVRCGEKGWVRDSGAPLPDPVALCRFKAEAEERQRISSAEKLEKARWLWSARLPAKGTIVERYLREARRYGGPIPATLGFLPARGEHPPSMIAAFGLAHEVEPGIIAIADDAVRGVHLTRLLPDGSDRERGSKAKIMIGGSAGWPIVMAPPNDLLGLFITEGIEDALSVHQLTGCGAWAAGSASRMPSLASLIPSYIECVTILVDDDDAGRTNSNKLASGLHSRGIEVLLTPTGSTV